MDTLLEYTERGYDLHAKKLKKIQFVNIMQLNYTAASVLALKERLPDDDLEKPQISRLFDGMTKNDNPVIFFFKMKDL